MPDRNLRAAILKQREELSLLLGVTMQALGRDLVDRLGERASIERELYAALQQIPDCKHLFVLNAEGRQTVSNITREGADPAHFGRDRADRPYMQGLVGSTDFRLSEAYISRNSRRPMLTAVQVLRDGDGNRVGFLGADYDLRELPATQHLYRQSAAWRQLKGDPAIRRGIFLGHRVQSTMDDQLDEVLPVMNELMRERGVFHGKLHFSSSRATVWLSADPYAYRLLDIEELLDPDICLALPQVPYPQKARVAPDDIMKVLQLFRALRFADDNIYLRSGSLNLFNGMVSVNFSCDGTHYLDHADFLARGLDFWAGTGTGALT